MAKKEATDTKKLAVITGPTSGIGEAIVDTLVEAGWQVVPVTRKDCDLSDALAAADLAEQLRERYPVIDALIHVAGIYHDDKLAYVNRDLEDYTPDEVVATMNVGVISFMAMATKLLPNITKTGYVIGISGTFETGASGWLPYYTSKRALEDFLVGLADDYKSGPHVFGISPSDTNTPAYAKFFPNNAKNAQPPNSISLLVEHIITGKSPYHSGDIIVVKHKKAAKGYHF